MSSWEDGRGEAYVGGPAPATGPDEDDDGAGSDGSTDVTQPTQAVGPRSPDERRLVDDPLTTVDSLQWAPDPTEQSPTPPPPPTVPPPPPVAPSPGSRWAPGSAGSAGPTGGFTSAPPGPAPAHLGEPVQRDRRTVAMLLVAIGVVVVLGLGALALNGNDDDSDQAGGQESPPAGRGGQGPDGPGSIIIGPTGVIGSWSGSEWVPRGEGPQPGDGRDFSVVGLGDGVTTATGAAVDEDCAAQQETSERDVSVPLDAAGGGPVPIAVAGVSDPRPRPVQQFDTGSETYRQAAVDVARGEGATTPPTVTQVLRADLDGNGTDEVVVAAEHLSDPEGLSPSPGDWSAVFLRRVGGDGVITDVLAASVAGTAGAPLEQIQTAALADLNGDGRMEIALNGRSASGAWTAIHALADGGAPSEVLRAGCGG